MTFRIIFSAFVLPEEPAVQTRLHRWLEADDRDAAKTEVRRIYDENYAALQAVAFGLEAINADPEHDAEPSFEAWVKELPQ